MYQQKIHQLKKIALALVMLGGVSVAHANENHLMVERTHEESWSYDRPELWGDLEANQLCRIGKEQSPINITRIANPMGDTGKLSLIDSYKPQDFLVRNNGHTMVFEVAGQRNSKLYINGVPYSLIQFHYHTPSEHTVMSAHYPMEIQLVHQNAQGYLAVVGVLVNMGKHNANIDRVISGLPPQLATNGVLRDFDIDALLPKDGSVYAYNGSLAEPPCTEGVQWFVKTTPIHADSKQLSTLTKLHGDNARAIQPQSEREVWLIK